MNIELLIKKIKDAYKLINGNKTKSEVRPNPDSKIKEVNLNENNQSGQLPLPWGPNGTTKLVDFTKKDALIYDEEGYWYPCKKSSVYWHLLDQWIQAELEKQFQDLINLTTKERTNLEIKHSILNNLTCEKWSNVSEVNDLTYSLSPITISKLTSNNNLK